MRLFDAGLELWPYGSAGLWWVASTQKAGPGVVKTRWLSFCLVSVIEKEMKIIIEEYVSTSGLWCQCEISAMGKVIAMPRRSAG